VDQLSVFFFFHLQSLKNKKELPDYLSAPDDVNSEINAIAWWKDHEY